MAILVMQLVSIFCILLLSHLPQASALALPIGPPSPSPNLVQPNPNHSISASNTLTVEQNIINLLRSLKPHPFPGVSQAKLISIILQVDDNESINPTLSSNIAQFRKIDLIFRSGDITFFPLGFSIENKWPSHWDRWNHRVTETVAGNWAPLSWELMFRRMSVEWADVILKTAGYHGRYGAVILIHRVGQPFGWCFDGIELGEHGSRNVLVKPDGHVQRCDRCLP